MKLGTAVLNENGIVFEGCFYSCGEALRYYWFSTNEQEISVFHSSHNTDFIFVLFESKLITCYRLPEKCLLPEKQLQEYFSQLQELKKIRKELVITKKGKRIWQ